MNCKTDRDRLIDLIHDSDLSLDSVRLADHLLANGVIVPPCKVGDVVYYPYEYGNKVLEKTVIKIVIEKEDRWLDVGVSFLPFENIGKTVFLTKKEAMQKLKELSNDEM